MVNRVNMQQISQELRGEMRAADLCSEAMQMPLKATAYVIFYRERLCEEGNRSQTKARGRNTGARLEFSLFSLASHTHPPERLPRLPTLLLPTFDWSLDSLGYPCNSRLTSLLHHASDSLSTLETERTTRLDTLRWFHLLFESSKNTLSLIAHLLHMPRASHPELLSNPLLPLDFLHTCLLLRTFC